MDGKEEILDLLRENARLAIEDISAMTKKSADEVKAIIKSLEDEGIILKYAAIVNPEKDINTKDKVRAEIEILIDSGGKQSVVDSCLALVLVFGLELGGARRFCHC